MDNLESLRQVTLGKIAHITSVFMVGLSVTASAEMETHAADSLLAMANIEQALSRTWYDYAAEGTWPATALELRERVRAYMKDES